MAEGDAAGPGRRYQAAVVIGAVILVAVALAAYFALSGGDDGGAGNTSDELGVLEPQRPEVGNEAPDFALLDARDGETVRRLSDYAGTPVVLNWYASWCGPCRQEIPHFQEAKDALGDDVAFLLVNLEQSQDQAEEFLDEVGTTLPSVLDSEGEVARHYRAATNLPNTFFINAEGEVTASGSGLVTEEALRNELAKFGLEY